MIYKIMIVIFARCKKTKWCFKFPCYYNLNILNVFHIQISCLVSFLKAKILSLQGLLYLACTPDNAWQVNALHKGEFMATATHLLDKSSNFSDLLVLYIPMQVGLSVLTTFSDKVDKVDYYRVVHRHLQELVPDSLITQPYSNVMGRQLQTWK